MRKNQKNEESILFQNCPQIIDLSVNEAYFTSRNDFIINVFELESGKESKSDEMALFHDYLQILDLPVNETKIASRNAFIVNIFALKK